MTLTDFDWFEAGWITLLVGMAIHLWLNQRHIERVVNSNVDDSRELESVVDDLIIGYESLTGVSLQRAATRMMPETVGGPYKATTIYLSRDEAEPLVRLHGDAAPEVAERVGRMILADADDAESPQPGPSQGEAEAGDQLIAPEPL